MGCVELVATLGCVAGCVLGATTYGWGKEADGKLVGTDKLKFKVSDGDNDGKVNGCPGWPVGLPVGCVGEDVGRESGGSEGWDVGDPVGLVGSDEG